MTNGGPGPGYPGWQHGGGYPPPTQQGGPHAGQQGGPYPPNQPCQQHPAPQFRPGPQQQPAPQFTPQQRGMGAPEPPLTLPGWGAIPAVLGAVLAIVGLFALKWVGDANFSDINEAINKSGELAGGNEKWLKVYLRQGVIIALALSAVAPVMWSLGSLRNRESVKRRGGLMKKSLSEGNTGPTRIFISALAGVSLVYHVVSLLLLTDGGSYLDELGPGPWVLVVGTALSVAGALIGPRLPRR